MHSRMPRARTFFQKEHTLSIAAFELNEGKLAIIGIELCQLVCAHKILDNDSNLKIHLISENAEAGLIESQRPLNHFQTQSQMNG